MWVRERKKKNHDMLNVSKNRIWSLNGAECCRRGFAFCGDDASTLRRENKNINKKKSVNSGLLYAWSQMLGPSMAQSTPCELNSAGISEIITWSSQITWDLVGANSFYHSMHLY